MSLIPTDAFVPEPSNSNNHTPSALSTRPSFSGLQVEVPSSCSRQTLSISARSSTAMFGCFDTAAASKSAAGTSAVSVGRMASRTLAASASGASIPQISTMRSRSPLHILDFIITRSKPVSTKAASQYQVSPELSSKCHDLECTISQVWEATSRPAPQPPAARLSWRRSVRRYQRRRSSGGPRPGSRRCVSGL